MVILIVVKFREVCDFLYHDNYDSLPLQIVMVITTRVAICLHCETDSSLFLTLVKDSQNKCIDVKQTKAGRFRNLSSPHE